MAAGTQRPRSCGIAADEVRALARDYGDARARPAAIRLNYGMQRVRGGGNAVRADCLLPALVGAWRHRAGGVLLSSSGSLPTQTMAALQRPELLAGRTPRTINMSTIGDDLLRPASPEFGPAIEALIVYNSNPVAVAPESRQGGARLRARRPVHRWCWSTSRPTPSTTPTTCCPPPPSWSTGTCTPATATPTCCSTSPAIAPLGEARTNTQFFRELARRMGFTEDLFRGVRRELVPHGLRATRWTSTLLLSAGLCAACRVPDAPFADGWLPHAQREVRVSAHALPAR